MEKKQLPVDFEWNDNGTVDDNANIVMGNTKDNLEVQIWSRPDETKYVKVILRSTVKPNILSSNQMDLYPVNMPQNVAVMAGALAEYQCEKYGDTHEPMVIAKYAMDAFNESLLNAGLRDSKIFLT